MAPAPLKLTPKKETRNEPGTVYGCGMPDSTCLVYNGAMTLKERAKKLKNDIPAVFLALKAKETPPGAKLLAALTVAYALSPIDLIHDFIPVLGYLDDIILLPVLVALTIRLIPSHVMQTCRKQAEGLWASGRPKRWYLAIPIVIVWLLALYLIIRAVWR